jgi:hypothetical protein
MEIISVPLTFAVVDTVPAFIVKAPPIIVFDAPKPVPLIVIA